MTILKLVIFRRVKDGNVDDIGDEEGDDDQISPSVEDSGTHVTDEKIMEDICVLNYYCQ